MSYTAPVADHWNASQDFKKGDYVSLRSRGDIWLVESVDYFQGAGGSHRLSLTWVTGTRDPGRVCKFPSSGARKLNAMEVIALASTEIP